MGRDRRICIAEADTGLKSRLQTAIEQSGFAIQAFDSGYGIVAMMDNWPHLFLIDIELPGINGIEVCKWLKSHEESRDIPVIFISGDPYRRVLAASAHADDYIEKPVTYDELMEKIKDVL